jgi:hypothetical protein
MSGTSAEEQVIAEKRKSLKIIKATTKEYSDSLSYISDTNYKVQSIKEFNKNGDLVTVYSSKKDSSIYLSAEYEYNNQHQRLICQHYYEDGQKGGFYEAIMSDSLIIGERRYPSVMSIDSSYFAFETDGLRDYDITYKDGETKDSTVYTNESGKRVLTKKYYKGKLEYFITFEYLTNDDYIERIFERDSTLRLKRYWKYGKDEKLLDRVEFNKDENITTWYSYTYDCHENEIESGVYKSMDKRLSFRSEKEYQKSNVTLVKHYNEENKLTSISEYFYDENGMNTLWISKSYKGEKPEISFIYKTEYEKRK